VANSIDLNTDYCTRNESRPFSLLIEHDGNVDSTGNQAFSYYYTPFSITFQKAFDDKSSQSGIIFVKIWRL